MSGRPALTLGDLLGAAAGEAAALPIAGLTSDSRTVAPGSVFFAIPGAKADGLAFAEQALAAGAAAVVAQRPSPSSRARATWIVVDDARAALAHAAARLHPRQPRIICAVTGTSGKTSVAAFLRQIWARLGEASASLGTIGTVAPSGSIYGSLTTPDPVTLHGTLDRLAGEGVTHVALEASSHGLEQKRLDGVRLSAGAFTNLSRDHLDYHADLDAYFDAKMRLFGTLLAPGLPAVVDVDSAAGRRAAERAARRGLKVFSVGAGGGDLSLLASERRGFSTRLTLRHAGVDHVVDLPLAGDFQTANALVAAGLAIATGSAPAATLDALAALEGAPGRLERAGERGGALALIDYAHKPDALEKALAALRPYARGRLIVVFGCGGDRDPGKRPLMGAIAARGADVVIVTDDNPRGEDPAAIRRAILAAAPGAREIGDRAAAIRAGVALLGDGDVLLVAGKGHETGQIVGSCVSPFSDREAVEAALRDRGK